MSERKKTNEIVQLAGTLFIIALVISSLLGLVNAVTAGPIADRKAADEAAAMRQVLPAADTFQEITDTAPLDFADAALISNIYTGTGANGATGYVVKTASRGFGGDIVLIVGLTSEAAVTGVVIADASETPGLGAKASEPAFINQFAGMSGTLSVVKGSAGDDEILAITGATITSKAVTRGVQAAIDAVAGL